MSAGKRSYLGSCHCGAVCVSLESERAPDDFTVRACQCSFCRRQGARCVSDPDGQAVISVEDPSHLNGYHFGLRTAAFLLCAQCGAYLGALMTEGDDRWVTLNINCFDDREAFGPAAEPVDYDAEDDEGRRARRRAKWTPARMKYGGD